MLSIVVYVFLALFVAMFIDLCVLFPIFAKKTMGSVVEMTWRKADQMPIRIYTPVVAFNVDGQEHRFENDIWRPSSPYQEGQSVVVQYLPGYEAHARIPSLIRPLMSLLMVVIAAIGAFHSTPPAGVNSTALVVLGVSGLLFGFVILKKYRR